MSKFEFIKEDGSTLSFGTKNITVIKNIPTKLTVNLWDSTGKHIPFEKLLQLGLQVKYTPTQTQQRIEFEKIKFMYENVAQFSIRVKQLKDMYDQLQVAYDCKVSDISQAIKAKFETLQQQSTFLANFNSLLDKGVKLNYQAANKLYCNATGKMDYPIDDFTMWIDFPKLVKWLPGTFEESEIPEERFEQIVTSMQRQEQLRANG